MRKAIRNSKVMTDARTILNVPLSRPGVGCRSCQIRRVHEVTVVSIRLSHHRDGGRSNPE